MSSPEREPDDTPVCDEHIEKFINWYKGRVKLEPIAANVQWWCNALGKLTLGELRHGIEAYRRFSTPMVLTPVQFWGLCRGRDDERSIKAFMEMREIVRGTKKSRNKIKEQVSRPRIESSDDTTGQPTGDTE